ncbi:hypothetical protein HZC53_01645 [Candidatus Uhrbacteria bacterium]|nr:hypothetical protein [Candidatus Uhrbacteria bacterium]
MKSSSASVVRWDFDKVRREDEARSFRRARDARPAVETPQDALLRDILGALNRMRILPMPQCFRAAREFKAYCRQYLEEYGHLTIPVSLPLHLIRR